MALAGSLQLPYDLGLSRNKSCFRQCKRPTSRGNLHLLGPSLSSRIELQRQHPSSLSESVYRPICYKPNRCNTFSCKCFLSPNTTAGISGVKSFGTLCTRSYNALQGNPAVIKVVSAIGIIAFALWGVGPLLKKSRNFLTHKNDGNWKKSNTYFVLTSYLQPLLLWSGALLLCRAVDPVVLPTEASQVVKQRLSNFLISLSTVLAFAYCLSGMIQQAQKFFMETSDPTDARNMGFQFAGKAVYSAVWVAAVSLFMELLGFSTQRWLTAGGLGTVLLTLAGREIFTNFLSSMMIHATRPFVLNEWIQTRIEGYDVSGHVEHVGWWSPTVIRGEDGEAVHIPNHKFTVNVVRNLSQKTHWRIKTHLGISHLDVSKINNIIADMRKVLAKNPQVEQQKLHRRVFLDYIDPENQAQMILISCFVKTPHIQEYLCVKEAVLLDLLRVIKHHRARLATPIRTVQKIYSDADLDNTPFSDPSFSRGGVASHRPLLLIEPPYKINGEDKTKTRPGRTTTDQDGKTALKTGSESKLDANIGATPMSEFKVGDKVASHSKTDAKAGEALKNDKEEKATAASNSDLKSGKSSTMKSSVAPKTVYKSPETLASDSKMSGLDSSSSNKISSGDSKHDSKPINLSESSQKAGSNKVNAISLTSSPKQQNEKIAAGQPAISKSSLEENIVLGVALEGSKRTLPIEEDLPLISSKEEELHAPGNGNVSPTVETDQRDG